MFGIWNLELGNFFSMDLSIIIVNYNTKDFLLPCVKGIVENTHSPDKGGIEYEIIIIDNKSADGSAQYVKQKLMPRFNQVRLIEAGANIGFSAGNNLGIRNSSGRYALIINSDILILDNALARMVEFMDARPKAGIAGPGLLHPDGSLQYFCYCFPTPSVLLYRRTPLARFSFARKAIDNYLMKGWNHKDSRTVDWVQGSCMIVRRSAIEAVGAMDEQYFMFMEDTDWCRRFWKNKWEVWYIAEVEIVHYHARASADKFYKTMFNRLSWIHMSSAIKYFRKWGC